MSRPLHYFTATTTHNVREAMRNSNNATWKDSIAPYTSGWSPEWFHISLIIDDLFTEPKSYVFSPVRFGLLEYFTP